MVAGAEKITGQARRVLVTGGAGFIGSHVAEALLGAGHEVAVLDDFSTGNRGNVSPGVTLYTGDVRDGGFVQRVFGEFGPGVVTHQAAQVSVSCSMRAPADDADVNIVGLVNVLEQAQRAGVSRFVFASSGGVLYGDVSTGATEENPARPVSPYGIAKWAGERYLEFFSREFDLCTVALRYANVYGPRQNPHGEAGVVAVMCHRMIRGEQVVINGDGNYIRDYVHAADVARVNLLALTRELESTFTPFNVGTGVATSVNTLEALLRASFGAATGRDVPEAAHGPPRPGDLRSNLLNSDKAARLLGWRPQIALNDGLSDTLRWFLEST